jgi:tRNA threonylcarbamoyladenosine biosynthesis protein TsaB
MNATAPLLAIDTSTTAGTVAVGRSDAILAEITLGVAGQHSTALMPAIDAAVRWAGLAPEDLGGVVVAGGPGSFTGLRIGAATAKGIATARGIPLWSYSGLLVAAACCAVPGAGREARVCALFDARRGDVFAACYRFSSAADRAPVTAEFEPEAIAVEALIERYRGTDPPLFTGDGARAHAELLSGEFGADLPPPHLGFSRASALLWLRAAVPELGRVADAASWEPDYVRASGAERIAAGERRRG